jgi:hypothetical protein
MVNDARVLIKQKIEAIKNETGKRLERKTEFHFENLSLYLIQGSIVEIEFSRLNSRKWPKDIPIVTENIQNSKFGVYTKKQNF